MNKQIPFQQFKDALPKEMPGRWFRRHIIVDHRHREILVQITWDGHGELKEQEYNDVNKGVWFVYVPKHRIDEYRAAIASGYRIVPIVLAGADDGQEHTVMQIMELTNTHNVIKDSSLAALPES